MKRTLVLRGCAWLLALYPMFALAAQKPVGSSSTTVTATIESIDKANRSVTLKRATGGSVVIQVPDQMEGFNSLKVGDVVTATYFEAAIISVRKPGDPVASSAPTTITTRKDRTPGSTTRREQTFTVTIQAIDVKAPTLTVKNPKGENVTLAVEDPAQLKNLKVGETVDVRYYESLMIKVARPPEKR